MSEALVPNSGKPADTPPAEMLTIQRTLNKHRAMIDTLDRRLDAHDNLLEGKVLLTEDEKRQLIRSTELMSRIIEGDPAIGFVGMMARQANSEKKLAELITQRDRLIWMLVGASLVQAGAYAYIASMIAKVLPLLDVAGIAAR